MQGFVENIKSPVWLSTLVLFITLFLLGEDEN